MNIIISMIPGILMIATPIIIAAIGGLFCERSGIVNICLEGFMMVGGFTAASLCYFLEKIPTLSNYAGWLSLIGAILAGLIYSILLALSTVNFKADHTIAGTAINLLAGGLTLYLCQIIFKQQRSNAFSIGISKLKKVPFLADMPIIGNAFKNIYPTIILGIVAVFLAYFLIFKSRFGLRLRSCGENPQASASMGINVYKMRWIAILISGSFAGLAGGIMVLTSGIQYTVSSIHGVGFIAIAALIFGKWNPFGILGASLFFGLSSSIGVYASLIPILNLLPSEFFMVIPYALTLLALILTSSKTVGPKAVGQIYDAGRR